MIFSLINNSDTVFDIGGNIGWYSISLYKAKTNIHIHTFEPIPSTYESLINNIKINDAKIRANNIGLSNKKQELTFYFYKEGLGGASARIMDKNRTNIEVVCHVDTLDNYFQEQKLDALDFIKCDVEGAELFMFQGGIKTIEKYKPIIFSEMLRKWAKKFNYHPNDIIHLLQNIGYNCYFVFKH